VVRGRTRDPLTRKRKEIRFVVTDTEDASVAYERLQVELRDVRNRIAQPTPSRTRFATFVVSLLEEKIHDGSIQSAASRQKWASVLERQLIPAFGAMTIDEVSHAAIAEWRRTEARQVHDGAYSPTTVNSWLAILRVIWKAATPRFGLERNPMDGIEDLDTSTHRIYTREQPNSLRPEEVPPFMTRMREFFPQHYAFVALGFATGWRPSSIRPLRRQGPNADVLWQERVILVRRSHTEGDTPMEATKTKRDQEVPIPEELMDILRWHAEQLPQGPMRESELLFPAPNGGFLDRGCLRAPFEQVAAALGLEKRVTPKAMRRTFQDLARAAHVNDLVTRAVSGHATEAMQRHYSTVSTQEIHDGLARVVSLARVRDALGASKRQFAPSGW
jgi:integrase